MPDSTLTQAIKEAYASAPATEIVYHTLEVNHPDFTAPIRVVRDRVELVATTEMVNAIDYDFTGTDHAYAANSTGVSITVNANSITAEATTTDPILRSPAFSIPGSTNRYVRARVRLLSGSTGWDGTVYYSVSGGHTESGSYYKNIAHPNPTAMGEWAILTWDMHNLSAGGTDWATSTIVQFRIDLAGASGAVWEIDWIAVGSGSEQVTFVPFAFDVVPPDVQSQQMPTCTIEMDNVGRELMSQLEAAYTSNKMITMVYRQYLESDKTVPQNDPPLTLTVLSITANVMRVSAVCGFGDLLNKRFPNEEYTAERFPGLVAQ